MVALPAQLKVRLDGLLDLEVESVSVADLMARALGLVLGALDQLAVEIDGPVSHMAAAGVRRAAALLADGSPWPLTPVPFVAEKSVSTMLEVTDEPMPWEQHSSRGSVSPAARRAASAEDKLKDPGSLRRSIIRRTKAAE